MSAGIQASLNKFAFLNVQDSSDEDAQVQTVSLNKVQETTTRNAKKKNRKRKKKQTNNASSESAVNEEWMQHDNILVNEMYDEDLKRALEISKLEFEETQSLQAKEVEASEDKSSQKEKKKTSKKTISLEEFHKHVEKTLPLNDVEKRHDNETKNSKKTNKGDIGSQRSNFFEEVEETANSIKRNEHVFHKFEAEYNNNKTSKPNGELKNKRDQKENFLVLKEKDGTISRLENEVEDLKNQFKHVKKRNRQLLLMLQQGEMKDKCELLLEVERLGVIRDELTQEVASLDEQLEQERSKSRKLKEEVAKLQNRRSEDVSSKS